MKFEELGLHPLLVEGIRANQFVDCTPIQEASIPIVLQGKDLAGLAQTGTGKTAAFALPLIDRILRSRESATETQKNDVERPIFSNWRKTNFILVLVPTRELAEQVFENIKKLGSTAGIEAVAIYGGTSYEPQKAAIQKGVDFIVATPGRLIDLYKEHLVDLTQVRAMVFDEADRMFDMGFKEDMMFILRRVARDRQFLVFSATLNFDVLNTAYEFGASPVEVNVSRDQAKAENVEDEIFHVGYKDKPQYLFSILNKYKPKQAIIFSNFKHNVERIALFLSENGLPAMGISSLISQNQRTRIMELFRTENNDRNILVATDVAARGLDIKGVDMVINFELPDDAENYVHRIGRTGRAGTKGFAYSLVGERDVEALQRIETYLGHKVNVGWLEDSEIITDVKDFPDEEGRRPKFRKESNPRGNRNQNPKGNTGFNKSVRAEFKGPQAGYKGQRPGQQNLQNQERKADFRKNPKEQPRPTQMDTRAKPQRQPDQKWSGGRKPNSLQQKQNGSRPHYHRPYKYKPNDVSAAAKTKQTPAAAPGMITKVSQFFKKLFG